MGLLQGLQHLFKVIADALAAPGNFWQTDIHQRTALAFCGIVRARDKSTEEYLGHWFKSPLFLQWRDEQARGANIQNLRFSQFENIEIPLPPLSEQKRIVKILNEQMAAVEKARKEAEEQLSIIEKMPSALLRKAFRGEI